MRVLGVLDLMHGCAVHARAGDRARYEPVRAIAGAAIEAGDAVALARTYRERFGLAELYVADLDAIQGNPPQDRRVSDLAAVADVWLDAGVSSADRARDALALGAARVIVGLETLSSWKALGDISAAAGASQVAFSLDLRDGAPMARADIARGEPADAIAARAADAGVESILVIDLKKVGASAGCDLALMRRVRNAAPGVALLAGGGVRDLEDIQRLANVGCDGVLVATAIHRGTLSAADVAAARAV